MKKTYMKPQAEVLKVQLTQMIAASTDIELDIINGGEDLWEDPAGAESRMFSGY